jgi:hypothetical protein
MRGRLLHHAIEARTAQRQKGTSQQRWPGEERKGLLHERSQTRVIDI